ncbi:MAG: PH domain-containing protein [Sporichthyaceae bacterium]
MSSPEMHWHAPTGLRRALTGAVALITAGIAVDQASLQGSGLGALVALPFAGFLALVVWVLAYRPYLRLTEDELIARNYLRTRRLDRAEIRAVSPAFEGLRIETAAGRTVVACAVQKRTPGGREDAGEALIKPATASGVTSIPRSARCPRRRLAEVAQSG